MLLWILTKYQSNKYKAHKGDGKMSATKDLLARFQNLLLIIFLGVALLACNNESNINNTKNDIEAIKSRGILIVGVKNDVPNFGLLNPKNGEIEGFEIDIAKALAKEILGDEDKLKLIAVNAKNRGALLDNNSLDLVIATFSITNERKELFNFSKPYYTDSIGFLVLKQRGYKSIKDMNGAIVAVAQSTTTRDLIKESIQKAGIDIKFSEFLDYPSIKLALKSNKVDAFCIDKSILLGYVDENSEILPDNLVPQQYAIASKKSNTSLANFVSEFIDKNEGLLESLKRKWNLH